MLPVAASPVAPLGARECRSILCTCICKHPLHFAWSYTRFHDVR